MHFWDTENPTEHYVREKANSRLYVSQLTKHAKSTVSLKRSSFCQLSSMFAVSFVAVTVIYLCFCSLHHLQHVCFNSSHLCGQLAEATLCHISC